MFFFCVSELFVVAHVAYDGISILATFLLLLSVFSSIVDNTCSCKSCSCCCLTSVLAAVAIPCMCSCHFSLAYADATAAACHGGFVDVHSCCQRPRGHRGGQKHKK